MLESGGKIIHNVIEENHLIVPHGTWGNFGCGLLADLCDDHTAIIRNNLIRGNTGTNGGGWGGGLMLIGGNVMMENNMVTENIFDLEDYAVGAGMAFFLPEERTFNKVIIRNNLITKNKANLIVQAGYGGGVALMFAPGPEKFQFYNNVVSGNESEGYGGGIYLWGNKGLALVNNTIFGNKATAAGNSFALDGGNTIVLLNNIIYSKNYRAEFIFWEPQTNLITAKYNLLVSPFRGKDPVFATDNTFLDPLLDPETYLLAESSPAVGRGVDSLEIDGSWYYAPPADLAGNNRPNDNDGNVDLGAFESAFTRSLLPEASLVTIQVPDQKLVPQFQPEIMDYEVDVLDTYIGVEDLLYIPADPFSAIDYNPAADILSENVFDKTSTISVTSTDGTVENIYKILYNALSTNGKLSALSVEPYTLDPEFDPEILEYTVTLPGGITEAPEVTAVSSDAFAKVSIYAASFADPAKPTAMTTLIVVTPDAGGKYSKKYSVLFSPIDGIEEGKEPGALKVYPNPANTLLTIETDYPSRYSFNITTMNGQLILNGEMEGTSHQIDLSSLQSGVYFITIRSMDFVTTRKIIKM